LTHNDGIEDFDHPAFTDPVYLKRKEFIMLKSQNYHIGD
jgi:hypothetical protein